jgi:hypothetical protein
MEFINVFDMMSTLAPVRKRGRPTVREKALEHDRDLERGIKHLKPSHWLQQDIRHPVFKLVWSMTHEHMRNRMAVVS